MKRLLVGLFALVLVPLGQCWAQQGIVDNAGNVVVYPFNRDFTGGGARALGMGGAFLGLSDDETAVTWNPAGLYNWANPYDQPVVSLGTGWYSGDAEYTLTGLQGIQSTTFTGSVDGITLASIVAPVRIKGHPFVGSIALNRVDQEAFGGALRFDTTVYYTIEDQENDTPRPYRVRYQDDFVSKLTAINFGFGTRLYDRVSMGAAVGVYTGDGLYQSHLRTIQDGILYIQGQRVVQTSDSMTVDSIGYSGVFFSLGLRYGGDRFSAGIIIRPPHTLKLDDDRTRIFEQRINGQITVEGTQKFHFDNNYIEIDQPLIIGGGVAYNLKENLLVAMDAEYRAFSGGEIRVRDSLKLNPGDKDTEFFSTYDPNWNNVLTFRTGGEYMWDVPGDFWGQLFPIVPVRAGFGWSQLPEPDVDANLSTGTASKTTFSLGTGVHWSQLHLDVAFSTWSFSKEYREIVTGTANQIYTASLDNSDNMWTISFTGYF